MARLVLVDTSDALPGLLPLHGWSALVASDLVLVGRDDHPFVAHLEAAGLAYEVLAEPRSLAGVDLAGGSPRAQVRARAALDRAEQAGELAYLFGPGEDEAVTRALGLEAARRGIEVEVVYFGVAPTGVRLLELVAVEQRLRGPGGCPWDLEQTHESLGRYAIEEVYELLEAIASGDPSAIREELGDVLLQVVFHAQIAADEGTFDIDDVAGGIAEKLVRRHPHVFADVDVADAEEVTRNWEALKAEEKPERRGPFDGVPTSQPALQLADAYLRRARKADADPFTAEGPGEAARRALAALTPPERGGDPARAQGDGTAATPAQAAVGELLAAAVALARQADVDPESALRAHARRWREEVEGGHG